MALNIKINNVFIANNVNGTSCPAVCSAVQTPATTASLTSCREVLEALAALAA